MITSKSFEKTSELPIPLVCVMKNGPNYPPNLRELSPEEAGKCYRIARHIWDSFIDIILEGYEQHDGDRAWLAAHYQKWLINCSQYEGFYGIVGSAVKKYAEEVNKERDNDKPMSDAEHIIISAMAGLRRFIHAYEERCLSQEEL